ncbi:MAG TPA: sugar phosphate isomerase/epimerase [Armatimonadota bacterium]|jgi:sugar phosphate isomerase/epimerase
MFRIGFCYPAECSATLKADFARLKAMGYDGVELWDQTLQQVDFSLVEDAYQTSGLSCAQLCPYFNFVDGQALWDESLRIAERYINWSERLDKPLLRVFTGKPWGEGVVGPDDATPAQWDAAIAGLQRVCDMAQPYGVRFALECHTGSLMEDTPNTLRLLQGVNRPNLGVNLQIPLKDGLEPVELSLAHLGRYTWHMHAHNYRSIPNGEQCLLGEGVMDYSSILSRLLSDGFSGYVSIEHASYGGTRDPFEVAALEAKYLLQLRDTLSSAPAAR